MEVCAASAHGEDVIQSLFSAEWEGSGSRLGSRKYGGRAVCRFAFGMIFLEMNELKLGFLPGPHAMAVEEGMRTRINFKCK